MAPGNLGVLLDAEIAEVLPATTSWWQAPGAPVPVSIRERGDRTPCGRVAPVADHRAQKERLTAERRLESERRAQAVIEPLAVGDRLGEVRLSAAAFQVLVELLGQATARFGPDLSGANAALVDAGVVLWIEPSEGSTTLRSATGDLTVHGYRLAVAAPGRRPAQPSTDLAEVTAE